MTTGERTRRFLVISAITGMLASAFLSFGLIATVMADQPQSAGGNADDVLVTIDGSAVTERDIERQLAQVPRSAWGEAREMALQELTSRKLANAYMRQRSVGIDEQAFAAAVEQLRTEFALRELYRQETTEEKVQTFIASHPRCFDGTKLKISHILIACKPYDDSAGQREAREKLQAVADRIKAGEISFAEAAGEVSDCPSKLRGGDLGEYEFVAPLDKNFLAASFSATPGEVSDVFRTSFGWHIVLVEETQAGDGQPKPWRDPESGRAIVPEQIARQIILAGIEQEILLAALDEIPVENHRD